MPNPPRAPVAPLPLLALLIAVRVATAEVPPSKWLPVAGADLTLHDSAIEPGVDAEILFTKTWVEDSYSSYLNSSRDHYVRLKVYTAGGAQKYSKIDIDYPLREALVTDVRARVVKPDGSTVEADRKKIVDATVVKLHRAGIKRRSIPLPGVTSGCVIEYRYHEDLFDDNAWVQAYDFQFKMPARRVEYYLKPLEVPEVFPREMTFHTTARTADTRRDGYYQVVAVDQRPYVEEPDSPPEYQIRGWMLHYYTTEELKTPEAFWRDYARKEGRRADAVTRPNKNVKDLAASICAGAAGDEAKVHALSDWIRLNFRILGSTSRDSLRAAGIDANSDARQALKQRAGSAEDAEMAFISLARAAGPQARLLRVPERSELFFDPNMMDGAFVRSFDAGIRLDGRWRGFDVAARYLPWDMLLWSEEMQPAVFCDPDSGGFITLDVAAPERSTITGSGAFALAEDGTLDGTVHSTFAGHANEEYRRLFEDVAGTRVDSVFVDALGWNTPAIRISNVTLGRATREWDPLGIDYHVVIPEHAAVTGKRMVLQPSAMYAHQPARFTAGTRRAAVCFHHAWVELDTLRIRLPQGWRVEAMDSPIPVRAEGVADYRASILKSDDGRELIFVRLLVVGKDGSIFFPVGSYPDVKKLFDLIHDRDQATVTLVREEPK